MRVARRLIAAAAPPRRRALGRPHAESRRRRRRHPRQRPRRRPQPELPVRVDAARRRRILRPRSALRAGVARCRRPDPPAPARPDDLVPPAVRPRRPLRRRRRRSSAATPQLVGLPLVGLRRYPGSASRWQNHAMAGSTAFVVELPAVVRGPLVRRAAKSVLTLAAEYASPDVSGATVAGRAE